MEIDFTEFFQVLISTVLKLQNFSASQILREINFQFQVASNTATANVLLPILADLSLTICQNPLYLIMTTAVTSSYAFMLPVATAPNAIVFGASSMTTGHMIKAGFGMNILTIITTLIAINSYGIPIYGLDTFPEWAVPQLPVNVTCT